MSTSSQPTHSNLLVAAHASTSYQPQAKRSHSPSCARDTDPASVIARVDFQLERLQETLNALKGTLRGETDSRIVMGDWVERSGDEADDEDEGSVWAGEETETDADTDIETDTETDTETETATETDTDTSESEDDEDESDESYYDEDKEEQHLAALEDDLATYNEWDTELLSRLEHHRQSSRRNQNHEERPTSEEYPYWTPAHLNLQHPRLATPIPPSTGLPQSDGEGDTSRSTEEDRIGNMESFPGISNHTFLFHPVRTTPPSPSVTLVNVEGESSRSSASRGTEGGVGSQVVFQPAAEPSGALNQDGAGLAQRIGRWLEGVGMSPLEVQGSD